MAAFKSPGKQVDGQYAAPYVELDTCQYTIPAAGTLAQGQALCLDVTQIYVPVNGPGKVEQLVLPTSANAGDPYGVYQGPPIVNPSATVALVVTIPVCQFGIGVVLAGAVTAGAAVLVGSSLIVTATQTYASAGTRTPGVAVGQALATGAVTAKGASLIAVPGSGSSTLLINAFINVAA